MKNYQRDKVYAWQVQISSGEVNVRFADTPADPKGGYLYNKELPMDEPDVQKLCDEVKKFIKTMAERLGSYVGEHDRYLRMWAVPGKTISIYGWNGRMIIELKMQEEVLTSCTGYGAASYSRAEWNAIFDFADSLAKMEWF